MFFFCFLFFLGGCCPSRSRSAWPQDSRRRTIEGARTIRWGGRRGPPNSKGWGRARWPPLLWPDAALAPETPKCKQGRCEKKKKKNREDISWVTSEEHLLFLVAFSLAWARVEESGNLSPFLCCYSILRSAPVSLLSPLRSVTSVLTGARAHTF